ncbi:ricin-type beta-trefoil lectin domain protein [Actinoplanes sp. NPDC049316]|uniref:RICIN domain-containing protein n=1 Tax=Actinoplanes sp. NPDC049316 TaxID=3154727 RepID=UPI003441ADC6
MKHVPRRHAAVVAAVAAVAAFAAGPAQAAPPAPDPVAIGQATEGDLQVLATDADTAGTLVKLHTYQSGLPAAVKAQRWSFEVVTAGAKPVYRIRHLSSNRCLKEAAAADGADVVLADCATANNQLWTNGTASYYPAGFDLRNKADGRCLDLYASADGEPATMWTCDSYYATQFWRVRTGGFDCSPRDEIGVCVQTPAPVFGVMLNFRQQPMSFTGPPSDPENGSGYNQMSNQVNWDPLDSSNGNTGYDYAEMGWRGAYDADTGTTAHGAYWLEDGIAGGQSLEEFHAIARPDSTLADGSTHTWLSQGNGAGQWDVYYDFSLVGTTRLAAGNRTRYLEQGLLGQYAEYTTLSEGFQNRLQTLDGNNVWHRPYLGEVAGFGGNVCGLPDPLALELGQPNTPPYCFTTSVQPRTTVSPAEVDNVVLGKPAAGSVAAAPTGSPSPAASSPPVPRTFNGVDQRALAKCLAADPNTCLSTVPGLAQCLAAHHSCNARAEQPAVDDGARRISATQAGRLAHRDLTGLKSPTVKTLTAGELSSRAGKALTGLSKASTVHVVTGAEQVHGLRSRTDRTYQGYTLVYAGSDGRLLYGCLGAGCPRKEFS